jgi:hypothetical protein
MCGKINFQILIYIFYIGYDKVLPNFISKNSPNLIVIIYKNFFEFD